MTNGEKQNLYSFYQEYAKSVRALAAAFGKVREVWDICANLEQDYGAPTEIDFQFKEYPFDKSFDELCLDVQVFKDEVQDWVDNIAPDELGL